MSFQTARVDNRTMRAIHQSSINVDVEDVPQVGAWDPSNTFKEANYIIIAFRLKGDKEVEHWANNLACYLTREKGEKKPAGWACHTEIILQQEPDVWRRFSIMKKTGEYDANGVLHYKVGRVHGIETGQEELKKYTFFKVHVPRERQYQAWRFFVKQMGAPFNMRAYILNINPFYKFGARHFHESMINHRQRSFFCTELVTLGLHAMGLMKDVRACDSSPNLLYRKCARMIAAQPTSSTPIM